MSTLLEQRYRRALRMLPASYRRLREEEMVETYLHGIDESDQDSMRPAWGEVVGIAALAVRSRLGAAGSAPGPVALGSTVRHFALFAVLLQAATALSSAALNLAWLSGSSEGRALFRTSVLDGGVLAVAGWAVVWAPPVLWGWAYLALTGNRRRTARILVTLTAAAQSVPFLLVTADILAGQPVPGLYGIDIATAAFAWLTALAVWCGFHTEAPSARLPGLPRGLALMGCCVLMGALVVAWPEGADAQWAPGWAFTAAAASWLLLRDRPALRSHGPTVGIGLAALGLAVLALRLVNLSFLLNAQAPTGMVTGLLVQSGAIALVSVAAAVTGCRRLMPELRARR